jgi:hypothetical protein
MSNAQWTFHGVPHVIILMAEILTIEINLMNLKFWKHKNDFKMTCVHKQVV